MPLQHVVKRGDSLWGLSGRHLGNFERWPELLKYHNAEVRKSGGNRGRVFPIKDPNVIFVGQILYLPIRDKHMMRTISATGTKSQAGNRAVPIDLRVKYTIGQSGKPIVYSQQVNNQTITIEMRGTITIKIVSPDRFRHNLELLMSENETRCRQKLKEIYNPAIVELTNKLEMEFQNGNPTLSSNGGIITIDSPILSNAGISQHKIRLILDTREKLKGKETLPNVCGYVFVDGRKISYEADVELYAEVNRNPINPPDSADYKKDESILNRIDKSLTAAGQKMGNYFRDRVKEVDQSMRSDYVQSQFNSFSWAASASIIDLGGALVTAISGKKIGSGNEMVGPVLNNATSGAAMVIHNIILP